MEAAKGKSGVGKKEKESMSGQMQVYDVGGDIQIARAPEVVIEEARKAASVLYDVVSKKPHPVMMNGEQYLEFEDWQTVARFYGISAKVKETEFLDYGGVQGFLAKAVAVRSDGMEISAAEAMCMNDEDKWSSRTKYAYVYVLKDGSKSEEEPPKDQIEWVPNPNKPGKKMPKKERIAAGEVSVPLFQLRSMAQTRACAKALRNVLAWVVVLAGYKPNVAEEMTGDEAPPETKPPVSAPQKKTEIKDPNEPATEPQLKAIHNMLGKLGVKDDFEKHKKISRIIEMPEPEVITSLTALTKGQASKCIEALANEGTK
jgi:hypothetical protein